jgi:hypothetical protein
MGCLIHQGLRIFRILSVLIFVVLGSSAMVSAAITPVDLGTAGNFAVLAGSAITNTGPTTINGDLGLSTGTSVTGFPPGTVTGTQHVNDSAAAQAQIDLAAAYNDAAGRTTSPTTVSGDLGGRTLVPGIYVSSSTLAISNGDLTLDAGGDANAVWIFQIGSTLTTAAGSNVILTGGAQARNVFWQIGTSATLGTGSSFNGTIMAQDTITLSTSAVLNGRALAQTGAVILDTNTVAKPRTISIAVTGNISDWAFTPGTNTQTGTLTVTSDSSDWGITARDAMEDNKISGTGGRLSEYNETSDSYITVAPRIFGTAMAITGTTTGSITKTDISLTGSDQTLETGSAPVTGQDIPLTFSQVVAYTDPHLTNGNQYRITIVFTAITA